ncbi:putative alpha-glucan, water dikinase [Rosa chinensis]|uniref:Putative alpha-glucan, water dikinase n=1 Tax=Rosa chinensis TaxID=74649 RepID=A0A2P6PGG3_ROSCH|nr:putative alpha-glucan, water dikinase [Rosa chinensis]
MISVVFPIQQVWASKWNERAFISHKKAKLDHENICMAVNSRNHLCRLCLCYSHKKSPCQGILQKFTER